MRWCYYSTSWRSCWPYVSWRICCPSDPWGVCCPNVLWRVHYPKFTRGSVVPTSRRGSAAPSSHGGSIALTLHGGSTAPSSHSGSTTPSSHSASIVPGPRTASSGMVSGFRDRLTTTGILPGSQSYPLHRVSSTTCNITSQPQAFSDTPPSHEYDFEESQTPNHWYYDQAPTKDNEFCFESTQSQQPSGDTVSLQCILLPTHIWLNRTALSMRCLLTKMPEWLRPWFEITGCTAVRILTAILYLFTKSPESRKWVKPAATRLP